MKKEEIKDNMRKEVQQVNKDKIYYHDRYICTCVIHTFCYIHDLPMVKSKYICFDPYYNYNSYYDYYIPYYNHNNPYYDYYIPYYDYFNKDYYNNLY